MDECMTEQYWMNQWKNQWWMNKWMNVQTSGQMNGWMNELRVFYATLVHTHSVKQYVPRVPELSDVPPNSVVITEPSRHKHPVSAIMQRHQVGVLGVMSTSQIHPTSHFVLQTELG